MISNFPQTEQNEQTGPAGASRASSARDKLQKSRINSRVLTPKPLAILTSESTVGDSLPHSTRLMKTVDNSPRSARLSWLKPISLRLLRIASPRSRRCFGRAAISPQHRQEAPPSAMSLTTYFSCQMNPNRLSVEFMDWPHNWTDENREAGSGGNGPLPVQATNHLNVPAALDLQVNSAIVALQCGSQDWLTSDRWPLNQIARRMQPWAGSLWTQFMPQHCHMAVPHPEFVFRLDYFSERVFGSYANGRDSAGLKFVMAFNLVHFPVLSEVHVAALVLHFLLHCSDDMAGVAKPGKYHAAGFRREAERLGILCPKYGCSCAQVIQPSPFLDWARQMGLTDAPLLTKVPGAPSKQTRTAWICDCPMVGYFASGAEVQVTCNRCHALFRPKAPRIKRK